MDSLPDLGINQTAHAQCLACGKLSVKLKKSISQKLKKSISQRQRLISWNGKQKLKAVSEDFSTAAHVKMVPSSFDYAILIQAHWFRCTTNWWNRWIGSYKAFFVRMFFGMVPTYCRHIPCEHRRGFWMKVKELFEGTLRVKCVCECPVLPSAAVKTYMP